MLKVMKSAVAIGSALSMLNFGSVASARQSCVTQGDIDAAYDQVLSATRASNEIQGKINNFTASQEYIVMENDYFRTRDQCGRPPWWGAPMDPRDVQDCLDAALQTFETAKADYLNDLEFQLTNAESDETAAMAAYNAIVTLPRCEEE